MWFDQVMKGWGGFSKEMTLNFETDKWFCEEVSLKWSRQEEIDQILRADKSWVLAWIP